jgi:hypothetical protein
MCAMTRHKCIALLLIAVSLAACSGDDDDTQSDDNASAGGGPELSVGVASRSVLPTVNDTITYLDEALGWTQPVAPNDVGAFVPVFDQGQVDVGNGESDAAWVHDDIRASALAIELGDQRVILVSDDVYMVFAVDAAEIEARARKLLPEDWADADIVIAATHNHHGPDTAFSVNDDWYSHMADQIAAAIADAAESVTPATLSVASQASHRFGMVDARDPLILDPRLNVLVARRADNDEVIATVVQWGSHPETTLGWEPPIDPSQLQEWCATKGWAADDCSAEGRYLTADYPGVLRARVQDALGGEVLYFNGAIGSQIGPGDAEVWTVDDAHPVGDGITPPEGAQPIAGCEDFGCQNLGRTDAIGSQLATAVLTLVDNAEPLVVSTLDVREQRFYTRLTNIGFRVLLADGDLGWQEPALFTCTGEPSDATCTDDAKALVDDPVLTPLVDSQIREGDVGTTQLIHLDLGAVGFLFMPGELPPELVVGLPADFATNPGKYYTEPELHAVGEDYKIPGALLDLVDEELTFTVGLGGDELGYWTPLSESRLKCNDIVLADTGQSCQALYDAGLLVTADAVAGQTCHDLWDDAAPSGANDAQVTALTAVCRYGQAIGRELGEPDGHYEETNSAGWDLVDDTWAAALELFGSPAG